MVTLNREHEPLLAVELFSSRLLKAANASRPKLAISSVGVKFSTSSYALTVSALGESVAAETALAATKRLKKRILLICGGRRARRFLEAD